jgi:NTP pyrophosphatase (non-canonical NTP hydrolase)
MELKKGTLKDLQAYISFKIKERGFDDESTQEQLLLLTEEVGELINAYRKGSNMYVDQNRASDADVGGEIVDVINFLFAVAIGLGIDVEREFRKKEKVIDARQYERGKK